jgi:hypothetical protein
MRNIQIIKTTIFAVIIFCCLSLKSQVGANDVELDKKYTPGQNSIFNELHKKNTAPSSSNAEIKNTIKFCPTLVFRQKVVFFYEREIAKGFSFHTGIGKAFGADVFEQFYFNAFSGQAAPNTLYPGLIFTNSNYSGSSVFFSAGIKVYFSGTTFDGGYIDLHYRHERMDYLLKPLVDGNRVDGANDVSFNMNSFTCGFGYALLGGKNNNITHDLFMNFGIKFFKYTQFDQLQIPSVYGNTEDIYRRSNLELTARILPSFSIGYMLGFGF